MTRKLSTTLRKFEEVYSDMPEEALDALIYHYELHDTLENRIKELETQVIALSKSLAKLLGEK